jgi:hypothetical protein
MFSELGIEPSAFAVAQHYGSIIDGIIIDRSDISMVDKINALGMQTYVSDILMRNQKDRGRLANEAITLIKGWEKMI